MHGPHSLSVQVIHPGLDLVRSGKFTTLMVTNEELGNFDIFTTLYVLPIKISELKLGVDC